MNGSRGLHFKAKRKLAAASEAVKQWHWFMALVEVCFSLFVSNCALLFAVFIYLVNTKSAVLTYDVAFGVIVRSINLGEIIVYILAVLAPAMWIMVSNWRARKYNVIFWILGFFQVAIIVCCFYIYGVSKTGELVNPDFVKRFAMICFPMSVLIWYVTVFFQRAFLNEVTANATQASGAAGSNAILAGLQEGGE
ncbi:hypothetical protein [Stenotrophomonas maltophilia]|uniref:hypothetical protein n=1 Tax=Stenotrophomonas maltophilia TaxID=40324 RepID=UPI0013D9EF5F|nr:hypothetical protein [Stenotrophomonas maltophilia]